MMSRRRLNYAALAAAQRDGVLVIDLDDHATRDCYARSCNLEQRIEVIVFQKAARKTSEVSLDLIQAGTELAEADVQRVKSALRTRIGCRNCAYGFRVPKDDAVALAKWLLSFVTRRATPVDYRAVA